MSQTVDILHDLVGFASVSRDPNRMLIDYVADKLADNGVEPVIIPEESGKKANLYAVTGPEIDGGVMLSGHTDVVPIDGQNWTDGEINIEESDQEEELHDFMKTLPEDEA